MDDTYPWAMHIGMARKRYSPEPLIRRLADLC